MLGDARLELSHAMISAFWDHRSDRSMQWLEGLKCLRILSKDGSPCPNRAPSFIACTCLCLPSNLTQTALSEDTFIALGSQWIFCLDHQKLVLCFFFFFFFFCKEVFIISMIVLWFLLPWKIFFQSAVYLSTPRLTDWPMGNESEKWVAKTRGGRQKEGSVAVVDLCRLRTVEGPVTAASGWRRLSLRPHMCVGGGGSTLPPLSHRVSSGVPGAKALLGFCYCVTSYRSVSQTSWTQEIESFTVTMRAERQLKHWMGLSNTKCI
jgi:hypothetical protein